MSSRIACPDMTLSEVEGWSGSEIELEGRLRHVVPQKKVSHPERSECSLRAESKGATSRLSASFDYVPTENVGTPLRMCLRLYSSQSKTCHTLSGANAFNEPRLRRSRLRRRVVRAGSVNIERRIMNGEVPSASPQSAHPLSLLRRGAG